MNRLVLSCGQALRRRRNVLLFSLACVLVFFQPMLFTVAIGIAIGFALLPLSRQLDTLAPEERRLAYQAHLKSAYCQRLIPHLGLLCFLWFLGLCFSRGLFETDPIARLATTGWILYPLAAYCLALGASLLLRQQPALGSGNKQHIGTTLAETAVTQTDVPACRSSRQSWVNLSMGLFMLAFFVSLEAIISVENGPITWLANWLLASARDANLAGIDGFTRDVISIYPTTVIRTPAASGGFFSLVRIITLTGSTLLFWAPATKLAAFLTTFSARCMSVRSLVESFVETMRLPCSHISLSEVNPWLRNISRTFWWLAICYSVLFWLVGFCGGPLGETIKGWIDFSLRDAGFKYLSVGNTHNLRLFIASVVALYGAVPVAVMSSVFLPAAKPKQLIINRDGLLLANGPYVCLHFRQYRLWSDLQSVEFESGGQGDSWKSRGRLILKFFSGGKLKLRASQLADEDLESLVSAIDEHADFCSASDNVLALRKMLKTSADRYTPEKDQFRGLAPDAFRSTVFVPLASGDKLPDNRGRVVRLISSRPLSAVYLARLAGGQLVVVKHFCLIPAVKRYM